MLSFSAIPQRKTSVSVKKPYPPRQLRHDDLLRISSPHSVLDLPDWKFGWDRARRRLGVCRLLEKSISLSVHFVRANLEAPMKSVTPSCMR